MLRISLWWHHIVPPIAAALLCAVWEAQFSLALMLQIGLFFISILGTAGFGYFLNDLFDIELDHIAQKRNSAAGLSPAKRIVVLLILSLIAILPWLGLPIRGLYFHLALLGCFILYSVPPFRFKERALAGVLCDMSYGHVLPIIITLVTFGVKLPDSTALLFLLIGVLCLKGFRNISMHQLQDRHGDRKARQNTFVLAAKPLFVHRFLNFLILPLELLTLFSLLWLTPMANGVWLGSLLFFIVYKSLLFASWYLYKKPWSHTQFEILHNLNDFYEYWLPFNIALSFSIAHNHYTIIIIVIYSLLFPRLFGKISQECEHIRNWLNTPF